MAAKRTTRQQEISQQLTEAQARYQALESEYAAYKTEVEAKLQAQQHVQQAQVAMFDEWKHSQMQSIRDLIEVQLNAFKQAQAQAPQAPLQPQGEVKAPLKPAKAPKEAQSAKPKVNKKRKADPEETESDEEQEEPAEKKRKTDPEAAKLRRKIKKSGFPKKAKTAYMCFTVKKAEEFKQVKPELSFGDRGREMGKEWKAMDIEAKAAFMVQAQEDKKRFEAARAEWEQKNPELAAKLSEARKKPTPRKPKAPKAPQVPADEPEVAELPPFDEANNVSPLAAPMPEEDNSDAAMGIVIV